MLGKRVQQQVAQVGTVDLRALERGVGRRVLLQQQGPVRLEQSQVLALAAGDRLKPVDQAGLAQRPLAGPGVNIEHAALTAGAARRLALVDHRVETVQVQHTGEDEAAQAGSDDGDSHPRS